MVEKEFNYSFTEITEANSEIAFDIYLQNRAYFWLMNDEPTHATVKNAFQLLPSGFPRERKKFLLIYEGPVAVAVSDLLIGFPEKDTLMIGFLLVGPKGRGHGTRIVEEIMQRFAAAEINKVRIGVLEENLRAFRFWKQSGFVVKEKKMTAVDSKQEAVIVMEKLLNKKR